MEWREKEKQRRKGDEGENKADKRKLGVWKWEDSTSDSRNTRTGAGPVIATSGKMVRGSTPPVLFGRPRATGSEDRAVSNFRHGFQRQTA